MTTAPVLSAYRDALADGRLDPTLRSLSPDLDVSELRARLQKLAGSMAGHFPDAQDAPCLLLRTPGRTELGGNHTDHSNGHVLAAAIQLDMFALASPREDLQATIHSEGFGHPLRVDIGDASARVHEQGTPEAIIRGMAARFAARGFRIGGFDAVVHSRVPLGSGLSSSAAFEVLVGDILNHLYSDGSCDRVALAVAAREAENRYFGKPCGLMDQLACALDGVLHIDFLTPETPDIHRVDADFRDSGLQLCVVDTGGSHADLTPEYAAITSEMRAVAGFFGQKVLRGLDAHAVIARGAEIRGLLGDRPILRALHYFDENNRVPRQARALASGDMDGFLRLHRESGSSSWRLLQNITPARDPARQPIALGLAVSERLLAGHGSCRVHGGGFAGTFQAIVPDDLFPAFRSAMEGLFGPGAVIPLFFTGEHRPLILPQGEGRP